MKTVKNKYPKIHFNFNEMGILYALIIFWVILAITNADFRNFAFYQNIVRQASFNAMCGIGMTFAIISGDFDLSVASQVSLSAVVMTLLLPTIGLIPTVIAILGLGILMGTFNGILIAKMRIPAFIATLAMQFAYRALAQIVNSSPVVVKDKALLNMSTGYILGIPIPFIVLIVLAIIGTIILRKTALGRHILAIGNSHEAAEISGISIPKTQILIYLLVGLFTAFTAIMMTSYLGSSNYGVPVGLEFTVISAVVLGGTALVGGKGSIFTTIVAAIFLVTITSALTSFGINSYVQKIVEGCILIFAFSINGIKASIDTFVTKSKARKELAARQAAGSKA
ncbi:branched-chain amino acid ABC transporter, permease protein [[Clostridium] methylpentosum DSM 5476]|jgi:ribose/xylose/arabinose/galactoside ABC-type transport system permease subunit|uniref:Branched-chain amino acid ABC transporter, permease protein n=1 Tax=[Clostridium] methylpentosum DSM 5476 TaxID=537013 RepID=C0EIT9_9FIRM|nr:branched-chain amino acid ABC transporter, permease protein [[Clostridium] methylpentosum DSM 5476]MDY3988908.1 ABC transporter permease [Massilioclostridium sp.]MEE1490529.1 ABC transporter permease [Massilioclostridium sp.]